MTRQEDAMTHEQRLRQLGEWISWQDCTDAVDERDAAACLAGADALRAALASPTRAQLARIEWASDALCEADPCCPACDQTEDDGHAPDCWLAAALASQEAAPPAPQRPEKPPMTADCPRGLEP